MRFVDVVLASVLLGMVIGIAQHGLPGFGASAAPAKVAAHDCGKSMCERVTWLRTPLIRAQTQAH